ncbi:MULTISPECIES: PAS domain-containing protein [Rhodovulum]|uniref:Aerotaxis receptor n=2 Tax=Rhodovulum TaxID=34008 RepID=A0A8E2VJY9_9RHOB|nr:MULTISPECIES: PAS domain-containing protein [Rhodovulum]PTW49636.1 aerotaxis receptor [Rhodovulum kholense]RAP41198.1 hypothetical protein BYZ73_10985 [Rhodovulum viride]
MAHPGVGQGDQPETGEVPFALQEIFYSRTDSRGVIRAGNAVFKRISGHDWPGLIGAPHRIIRHPDMPRAVFWLFWQTIQSGRPIGAYVKNLAKDGRYYWVFAVVMPMDDGYLSVRIKPSGPLFPAVQAEYRALRARELADKLSPEDSAALLLERLTALGFPSYEDFMAQALGQELAQRASVGSDGGTRLAALDKVIASLTAATREQGALIQTFEALQSIPTNMRIFAARLEPVGGPITAISDNYKVASAEIIAQLHSFAGQDGNLCDRLARVVGDAVFMLAAAEVQSDLLRQFRNEKEPLGPADRDEELALLGAMQARCTAKARADLHEALAAAATMSQTSRDLRRVVLGLDSIRVMGRVECGRLAAGGEGLAATIDQLETFHADIRARLEALIELSEQIRAGATRYAA